MLRISHSVFACGCVITICATVHAHRPTISDGSAVEAAKAIEFKDVQISRVVYHEVTLQAPRVWITFELGRPQQLRLQLGVPLIERLRDYRPVVASLESGCPKWTCLSSFPANPAAGSSIHETRRPGPSTSRSPETNSWILSEQNVELPAAGRYYVVAYEPSGRPGKLWVALGTKEAFEAKDLIELPGIIAKVRGFHELPVAENPLPNPVNTARSTISMPAVRAANGPPLTTASWAASLKVNSASPARVFWSSSGPYPWTTTAVSPRSALVPPTRISPNLTAC